MEVPVHGDERRATLERGKPAAAHASGVICPPSSRVLGSILPTTRTASCVFSYELCGIDVPQSGFCGLDRIALRICC